MSDAERIYVKGVAFDLIADDDGKIRVCRNGELLKEHLEEDSDGKFRVSFISQSSFNEKKTAIEHLAYWHTFERYKKPLKFKMIQWPDGTTSRVVAGQFDDSLQMTIWQIEIKVEEARDAAAKLPEQTKAVLGKHRVHKAEIGLKVHRAIELMLKVLLGKGAENDEWRFYDDNKTHALTLLYDKLVTQDSAIAAKLDEAFQNAVMAHGDPAFGSFVNPFSIGVGRGMTVTMSMGESITNPGARRLRDHLTLLDINSVYSQAYLGDAVQRISPAYLKYLANAGPFLDFVEAAMREVVTPCVRQLLRRSTHPIE